MLVDPFGRVIDYARISVTDHCNLRCIYCNTDVQWYPPHEILRNEEIVYIVDVLVSLGVKKVRFTGGEPLLRRGFFDIIEAIRRKHSTLEICITTNGVLLENFVDAICEYKIQKVNVSLDSLNSKTFVNITGVDVLNKVINGIEKLITIPHVECKINTVIMESTLDELPALLEFAAHVSAIRFIERMPVSDQPIPFVSAHRLLTKLCQLGDINRNEQSDTFVAVMYYFKPHNKRLQSIKLGIIPAISQKFCNKCNRLRITADGKLLTCLHDTHWYDIKQSIRNTSCKSIDEAIREAIQNKPKEHTIMQCNEMVYNCCGKVIRSMSKVGG